MKRGPTAKQRKAVLDTLENLGSDKPKTKQEILLGAGYAQSIAENPQIVENSKGWLELMEQYLPDSKLAEVHQQGLEANKVISANITYGDADEKTNDFIEVPDHPTRYKYLELGYKAKKHIGSDTPQGGGSVIVNIVSFHQHGDNTTPQVPTT